MTRATVLTYASLILRGESLDPRFWTEFFGANPSSWARSGGFVSRSGGLLTRTKSSTGLWTFNLENPPPNRLIDSQVEALAEALNLPRVEFVESLINSRVSAVIFLLRISYKWPSSLI